MYGAEHWFALSTSVAAVIDDPRHRFKDRIDLRGRLRENCTVFAYCCVSLYYCNKDNVGELLTATLLSDSLCVNDM
jgi:hypothetical protein